MRYSNRFLSALLIVVALAAHGLERPNIVLILTDDLGYGHIGSYGQQKIKTPNLDRMATEGMRFTQAYAGAALCAASRSVLMTGYHGGHTPVRANGGGVPLRDEDLTVAEVLKAAGYTTALFGKWGLGDADTTGVPNKQGFDEFFGTLHQRHAQFQYTDYLWHNETRHLIPDNRNGARKVYTHDLILGKALDYLQADHAAPFFCFVSITIPHHEWTAPESAIAPYRGEFPEVQPEFNWREGYHTPDAPRATMAGMISHMDQGVGRILDALKAKGIAENTLVLFTSDNGPDRYSIPDPEFFDANGPLRGYKYDQYEGGIRVPALAWWPGTINPGESNHVPWHFADFLPTCADLAGAQDSAPQDLDGLSIRSLFQGQPSANLARARFFYWEDDTGQRAGLLGGDWKIVQRSPDSAPELYDLSKDPGETRDLRQENPEMLVRLYALLEANHTEAPLQKNPEAPDGRLYE
jgi:arylsulfatase A